MTIPIYTPPLAEYEEWGQRFVAGQFNVSDQAYVIVFHEIQNEQEMRAKGYDIELPNFQFPASGMVEVMFDAVSDLTGEDFGGFNHVEPAQAASPVTLLKVISIIEHHYNIRAPGGYLFYAATTAQDLNRKTDLTTVYDIMLGLIPARNGKPSKIAGMIPEEWRVINGLSRGGRGYAIIC
ncbi:hypothetical protein ACTUSN_23515 [Pantoea ananatis]|uniref:hypothetical protein n=1 Tax=Pantoea ananas TaxID=553 RepID=UPI003FA41C6C